MELAHLFVQILIFLGLVYYARETLKIRKVSQEQNEITQRPCLVPLSEQRDFTSAVLSGSSYDTGERVLAGVGPNSGSDGNNVGLRNIGNGHAFNVRYEVQHQGMTKVSREDSYLPYVLRQEPERIYLSLNSLREYEDSELTLSYESLGRRRYESKIRIERDYEQQLVLTDFQFKEATPQPWWVKITR